MEITGKLFSEDHGVTSSFGMFLCPILNCKIIIITDKWLIGRADCTYDYFILVLIYLLWLLSINPMWLLNKLLVIEGGADILQNINKKSS